MKPDHGAAKYWAEAGTGAPALWDEEDLNLARAYLDISDQLADARALLECVTEDEIGGTPNLFCPDGGWEQWWDKVKLFLAHTKGQNE